jgi:hypothetical protein
MCRDSTLIEPNFYYVKDSILRRSIKGWIVTCLIIVVWISQLGLASRGGAAPLDPARCDAADFKEKERNENCPDRTTTEETEALAA